MPFCLMFSYWSKAEILQPAQRKHWAERHNWNIGFSESESLNNKDIVCTNHEAFTTLWKACC